MIGITVMIDCFMSISGTYWIIDGASLTHFAIIIDWWQMILIYTKNLNKITHNTKRCKRWVTSVKSDKRAILSIFTTLVICIGFLMSFLVFSTYTLLRKIWRAIYQTCVLYVFLIRTIIQSKITFSIII